MRSSFFLYLYNYSHSYCKLLKLYAGINKFAKHLKKPVFYVITTFKFGTNKSEQTKE